jgi:hypothetical protein
VPTSERHEVIVHPSNADGWYSFVLPVGEQMQFARITTDLGIGSPSVTVALTPDEETVAEFNVDHGTLAIEFDVNAMPDLVDLPVIVTLTDPDGTELSRHDVAIERCFLECDISSCSSST